MGFQQNEAKVKGIEMFTYVIFGYLDLPNDDDIDELFFDELSANNALFC